MIAKTKRTLQGGQAYERFFTPSPRITRVVDKWATTDNTVALCLAVIRQSAPSVQALAETFRRPTLRDTCRQIWEWVYAHIAYEKDEAGHEQIRYPNRSWADRRRGVDCDDYAVFIGACLTALGIPAQLRVTAYKGGWQHIYPIVPVDGDPKAALDQQRRDAYIVIDDVTDAFDYEVPYTKKFDTPMQLEALSGLSIDGPHPPSPQGADYYVDGLGNLYAPVDGLAGLDPDQSYYVDGLGNIFKKIGGAISAAAKGVAQAGKFVGGKVASAASSVATAAKTAVTTPVRLGILAYMKLNVANKAAWLRHGYVRYGQLQADRGIGPQTHRKIVETLGNLQAKFTGMGGDANTLRMAILTGNGNKDRYIPSTSDDLQGLGVLLATDPDWRALEQIRDLASPVPLLAGLEGLSGDGLGIAPAVVIGAATAVLNTILKVMGTPKENDPNDPVPAEYQPEEVSDEDDADMPEQEQQELNGFGYLGAAKVRKLKVVPTKKALAKATAATQKPPVRAATSKPVKALVPVGKPVRKPVADTRRPKVVQSTSGRTTTLTPLKVDAHVPAGKKPILTKAGSPVTSTGSKSTRVRKPINLDAVANAVEQGGRIVQTVSKTAGQLRRDLGPIARTQPATSPASAATPATADEYISPQVVDTTVRTDNPGPLRPIDVSVDQTDNARLNADAASADSGNTSGNTGLMIAGAVVAGLLLLGGGNAAGKASRSGLAGAPRKRVPKRGRKGPAVVPLR